MISMFFQRVGCDLRIGSSKKVDACGVCGGNGSTCSQPMYQWDMAPMSLCSATCGGGNSKWNIYAFVWIWNVFFCFEKTIDIFQWVIQPHEAANAYYAIWKEKVISSRFQ